MNKIELIDAETLYFKPIDHPKILIEGILSNGLAILSGDSKIGKSWMVLWFCLKLAKGEPIWGLPTAKTNEFSDVLRKMAMCLKAAPITGTPSSGH